MSWIKKITDIFANNQEDDAPDLVKLGDSLKNADLDYKFAQLFTLSGGFFNYCANEAEALKTLNQIVQVERISSVFCCDDQLQNFLRATKPATPFTPELTLSNDCAFITCEYLIAFDGRIMLSHNNILHYHSSRLPEKIVVLATLSQIVPGLTDAMGKIKRQGNVKNLTSISGNHGKLDTPNKDNTKLFLLLLED